MSKNKKMLTRTVAIFIVLTLMFANSSIVINHFVTLAKTNELGKQESSNSHKNISFDSLFVDENENKGYKYETEISNNNLGIKLNLQVKKSGYLKNATITLKADGGLNYSIGEVEANNLIESVEGNKVKLNQINSGENLDFIIPIKYKETNKIDNLNKNTTVELSGTYVDNNGDDVKIVEDVILNLVWVTATQMNIETNITKYVPYSTEQEKGIIVQTLVKTSLEDTNIPVEKTELEIDSIEIEGQELKQVSVESNTRDDFTSDNWNYDKESGKINISTKNKVQDDTSENFKSEEFLVTYIFSGNEDIELPITINSKISGLATMFGTSEKITLQKDAEYKINEKVGEIVTLETKNITEEINKGNILANKYNEEKEYNTEYKTKTTINISGIDLIDKIAVKDIEENFIDKDGNKFSIENTSYYKSIKVLKTDFDNILGSSGKITIKSLSDNVTYEINEATTVEDKYYVINFEDNISKMLIETSKPINSGNLNIETTKNIKETKYSSDELKTFTKINSIKSGSIFYIDNVENKIGNIENSIKLTDTQTNAVLTINKNSLGTIIKNENVELKVEFNNDKLGTDFYKNPSFEIILPKYIEEVKINNVAIANGDDNFKISSIDSKVENSRVVIRVTLEGTQKNYSLNNLTKGTNLIINTDMTLNLYTPSSEDNIVMNYTNEIANKYAIEENGKGKSEVKINYSAPTGLVSVNSISNYNNKGTKITSVNQGKVTDKIEIYDDEKTATMEILSINNNDYDCTDVRILGRIPFKGNKDIETGKDLGTTVDTKLAGAIKSDEQNKADCIIYYSENPDATEDINNVSNGWKTNIDDYSKVKSYLIVLKDYTMSKGDVLRFTYDYKIPANLEHNTDIYSSFVTYFNSKERRNNTREISNADIVGLTTGAGPQLTLETTVNVGNDSTIKEYEKIKYSVKVTNTGSETVNNIVVKTPVPEGTNLIRYKEVSAMSDTTGWDLMTDKEYTEKIESLEPNDSKVIEFYVQVNKLPTIEEYYSGKEGFSKNQDGSYSIFEEYLDEYGETKYKENKINSLPEIKIECKSSLTAEGLSKELQSNTVMNKVEKAKIVADENVKAESNIVKELEELTYTINVKNTSEDTLKNITVTKQLPKGLNYSESYILGYDEDGITPVKINSSDYDVDQRIVTWTIETLEKGESEKLKLVVLTANLDSGIYETDVKTNSTIKIDNQEYKTAEAVITVAKPKLVITQKSDKTNMYIKEGENITYTFTVKNEGKVKEDNLQLIINLPDELKISNLKYIVDGVEMAKVVATNGDAQVSSSILPNSSLIVNLTAKVNSINEKEKKIVNSAIAKTSSDEEIKINEITNIIEKTEKQLGSSKENQKENKTEEEAKNTYKLRGTAWLDTNKNGQKDSEDSLIEGMEIRLIDAKTGNVLKNTASLSDGQYSFDNLENGLYYVMFLYNSSKYGLTDYKKQNVAEDINSDVISSQVEEKGKTINVGLTDTIEISNGSLSNIDIGLIEASIFDLALSKNVTKITVQNKDGVKVEEFNDVTLAKIDIPAKRLSDTKVLVEYKITIKNEGDLEGYAKQIIDYKPNGMEFNSELNPNWYEGSDGNLYTDELANTIIKPGETKTVSLVLTKQMTEENTGIVNNTAEISIAYNTAGVSDKDSTPKNKVQGEDDLGSADAILTVNTGDSLIYISVIIAITVVGIITIYFIRKNRFRIMLRRGVK